MILIGLSFTKIALGVLYVSIAVIVFYILYRKLLTYLNREVPDQARYCVLSPLENDPAHGELEFYFTSEETKMVTFEIMKDDHTLLATLADKEFPAGQHIIRFDSTTVPDGPYFYQIRTDNQKTMKRMTIANQQANR